MITSHPPLRLVFLGSDPIALPLLDWLASPNGGAANATIIAIYTQPDRPVGRGQKIQPNAIKLWALARDIPVRQPEKLTDATRAELAALAPDLALVMAYGHILRDAFIATPRLGTLNLHASLLPKYRGASPIQTAIASGERETGVTLMRVIRQLDAGPVADAERVPIAPLDTALDVEQKLAAASVPLLARALPKLAANALAFTPQNDAEATHCRRLEKTDGALDFARPAALLAARINALHPWPACTIEISGQQIKVGGASSSQPKEQDAPAPLTSLPAPGTILPADSIQNPQSKIQNPNTLNIATSDGILRIHRLQRPGGKMLPAQDFLRGFPIPAGTQLPSRPMPPLVT